jgi:hypothetical protein
MKRTLSIIPPSLLRSHVKQNGLVPVPEPFNRELLPSTATLLGFMRTWVQNAEATTKGLEELGNAK